MSTHADLGLSLYPDFITAAEEAELLQTIRAHLPKKSQRNITCRNAIIRFGCAKPFTVQSSVIPPAFARLCERLAAQGYTDTVPDAVTINEYYPTQAIGAHIDPPQCGPVISVLSLASSATMVFTKPETPDIPVLLLPRSLVQMRDQIRTDWKHEIQPVKALRYSVVFRCSTPD